MAFDSGCSRSSRRRRRRRRQRRPEWMVWARGSWTWGNWRRQMLSSPAPPHLVGSLQAGRRPVQRNQPRGLWRKWQSQQQRRPRSHRRQIQRSQRSQRRLRLQQSRLRVPKRRRQRWRRRRRRQRTWIDWIIFSSVLFSHADTQNTRQRTVLSPPFTAFRRLSPPFAEFRRGSAVATTAFHHLSPPSVVVLLVVQAGRLQRNGLHRHHRRERGADHSQRQLRAHNTRWSGPCGAQGSHLTKIRGD